MKRNMKLMKKKPNPSLKKKKIYKKENLQSTPENENTDL